MTEAPRPPRLVVTGAGSGIGAAVMAEAQTRAIDVTGVEGFEQAVPARHDAVIRRGAWTDGKWLGEALSGATAVVHTLVDSRPRAPYDELAATNLDVTEAVYRAATRAGADRFVLVSRARLVAPSERYATEEHEPKPHNAFEQTLYDAEVMLRGLANRGGGRPEVVVLRTAPVYGFRTPPSESPWLVLPAVFASLFDLLPGLSGGPRCHWAHLEDAAGAAVHLAVVPELPAATVHVADDTPVSLGELYNSLVEAGGYPLGIKVPYPGEALIARLRPLLEQPLVLSGLERVLNQLWGGVHFDPEGGDPRFKPSFEQVAFHGLFEEAVFDNSRLKASGYTLRHPDVRKGMRDMITDYQKAGELPRPRPRTERVDTRRPGLGSHFAETMQGTWRSGNGAAERAIRFDVTLTTPGLHLPLNDRVWNLDGRLWADGLADGAVIEGTLELAPRSKRQLIYEFGFRGDDGRSYRIQGTKNLRLRDPLRSFTEMTIEVHDDRGERIGTGVMRFDVRRDLVSFVRSWGVGRLRAAS